MEKMSRKQEKKEEINIFGVDGDAPPHPIPLAYMWKLYKIYRKKFRKKKIKPGLLRSGSRTYKNLAAIVRMSKSVKHDDAIISSFIEFC